MGYRLSYQRKSVSSNNLGKKVEDKFTNLTEIGFSMECLTVDFLQFLQKNVKVWPLGGRLDTWQQTQVFEVFSWNYLISQGPKS